MGASDGSANTGRTTSVTVAVPVKNRCEQMLRCLDSLLSVDYPRFDILVLDNGSTDGTAEACRERASASSVPVRVVSVDGTLGFVRNQAAVLCSGEILAFIDSDCEATPGWLQAGVAALQARPDVGLVTGRTLPVEPLDRPWPATVNVTGRTGRFESCNIFFRTAQFAASDGFDETVGDGWEDTAAGFAMHRAGWDDAYAGDALIYHDVTYPGYLWHLQRAQRNAKLGLVVKRYPEIRGELLWRRIFLHRRDAFLIGGAVGLAYGAGLARGGRRRQGAGVAAAAVLPYVFERGPRELTRGALEDFPRILGYDVAIVIACMRGAVKYRTLIL